MNYWDFKKTLYLKPPHTCCDSAMVISPPRKEGQFRNTRFGAHGWIWDCDECGCMEIAYCPFCGERLDNVVS